MTNLLNQLPALIGVIIGALGSYAATSRNEALRFRRQQQVRWDAERKAAYTEYGRTLHELMEHCARLATSRGASTWYAAVSIQDGNDEYMRLCAERGRVWESVRLVGGKPAIATAKAWQAAVYQLQEFVDGQRTDLESWPAAFQRTKEMRDAFYTAARADLDIGD